MAAIVAGLALLAVVVAPGAAVDPEMVCVGCTVLASLAQEGAPVPWAQLIEGCGRLGTAQRGDCEAAVAGFQAKAGATPAAPAGQDAESPDVVCQSMGLCNGTCTLFDASLGPAWPLDTLPPAPPAWPVQAPRPTTLQAAPADPLPQILDHLGRFVSSWSSQHPGQEGGDGDDALVCDDPLDLYCKVMRFADYHLPLVDKDGDRFNDFGQGTLRGFLWRGKDCSPEDGAVYPGRKATDYGALPPNLQSHGRGQRQGRLRQTGLAGQAAGRAM